MGSKIGSRDLALKVARFHRRGRGGNEAEDDMTLRDVIYSSSRPTQQRSSLAGKKDVSEGILIRAPGNTFFEAEGGRKDAVRDLPSILRKVASQEDPGIQMPLSRKKRKRKDLKEILGGASLPSAADQLGLSQPGDTKKARSSLKKGHGKGVDDASPRFKSVPLRNFVEESQGDAAGSFYSPSHCKSSDMIEVMDILRSISDSRRQLPESARKKGLVHGPVSPSLRTEGNVAERQFEIPLGLSVSRNAGSVLSSIELSTPSSFEELGNYTAASTAGFHTCEDPKDCLNACVAKALAPNLDHMSDEELIYWYEEVMRTKFVRRLGEKVRGRIRRVIRAEAKRTVSLINSPGATPPLSSNSSIERTPRLNLVVDLEVPGQSACDASSSEAGEESIFAMNASLQAIEEGPGDLTSDLCDVRKSSVTSGDLKSIASGVEAGASMDSSSDYRPSSRRKLSMANCDTLGAISSKDDYVHRQFTHGGVVVVEDCVMVDNLSTEVEAVSVDDLQVKSIGNVLSVGANMDSSNDSYPSSKRNSDDKGTIPSKQDTDVVGNACTEVEAVPADDSNAGKSVVSAVEHVANMNSPNNACSSDKSKLSVESCVSMANSARLWNPKAAPVLLSVDSNEYSCGTPVFYHPLHVMDGDGSGRQLDGAYVGNVAFKKCGASRHMSEESQRLSVGVDSGEKSVILNLLQESSNAEPTTSVSAALPADVRGSSPACVERTAKSLDIQAFDVDAFNVSTESCIPNGRSEINRAVTQGITGTSVESRTYCDLMSVDYLLDVASSATKHYSREGETGASRLEFPTGNKDSGREQRSLLEEVSLCGRENISCFSLGPKGGDLLDHSTSDSHGATGARGCRDGLNYGTAEVSMNAEPRKLVEVATTEESQQKPLCSKQLDCGESSSEGRLVCNAVEGAPHLFRECVVHLDRDCSIGRNENLVGGQCHRPASTSVSTDGVADDAGAKETPKETGGSSEFCCSRNDTGVDRVEPVDVACSKDETSVTKTGHPCFSVIENLAYDIGVPDSERILSFETSRDDREDQVLSLEEYIAGHHVDEDITSGTVPYVIGGDLEDDVTALLIEDDSITPEIGNAVKRSSDDVTSHLAVDSFAAQLSCDAKPDQGLTQETEVSVDVQISEEDGDTQTMEVAISQQIDIAAEQKTLSKPSTEDCTGYDECLPDVSEDVGGKDMKVCTLHPMDESTQDILDLTGELGDFKRQTSEEVVQEGNDVVVEVSREIATQPLEVVVHETCDIAAEDVEKFETKPMEGLVHEEVNDGAVEESEGLAAEPVENTVEEVCDGVTEDVKEFETQPMEGVVHEEANDGAVEESEEVATQPVEDTVQEICDCATEDVKEFETQPMEIVVHDEANNGAVEESEEVAPQLVEDTVEEVCDSAAEDLEEFETPTQVVVQEELSEVAVQNLDELRTQPAKSFIEGILDAVGGEQVELATRPIDVALQPLRDVAVNEAEDRTSQRTEGVAQQSSDVPFQVSGTSVQHIIGEIICHQAVSSRNGLASCLHQKEGCPIWDPSGESGVTQLTEDSSHICAYERIVADEEVTDITSQLIEETVVSLEIEHQMGKLGSEQVIDGRDPALVSPVKSLCASSYPASEILLRPGLPLDAEVSAQESSVSLSSCDDRGQGVMKESHPHKLGVEIDADFPVILSQRLAHKSEGECSWDKLQKSSESSQPNPLARRITRAANAALKLDKSYPAVDAICASSTNPASPLSPGVLSDGFHQCASNWEFKESERSIQEIREKTTDQAECAAEQSLASTVRFSLTAAECDQLDNFEFEILGEWQDAGKFLEHSEMPDVEVDRSGCCLKKRKMHHTENESGQRKRVALDGTLNDTTIDSELDLLRGAADGASTDTELDFSTSRELTSDKNAVSRPVGFTECRMEPDTSDSTSTDLLSTKLQLRERFKKLRAREHQNVFLQAGSPDGLDSSRSFPPSQGPVSGEHQSCERLARLRVRERRNLSLQKAFDLMNIHKSKLAGSEPLPDGQQSSFDCIEPSMDSVKASLESAASINPLTCEQLGEEETSQEFEQPSKLPSRRKVGPLSKTISPVCQLELMHASDDSPQQKTAPIRLKVTGPARPNTGVSLLSYLKADDKVAGKHEANGSVVSLDSSDEDTEDSCGIPKDGSSSPEEYVPKFSLVLSPASSPESLKNGGEHLQRVSLALSPTSPSPDSLSNDSNQNICSQEPGVSPASSAPSSKGILKIAPQACRGPCKCDECALLRSQAGTASDFIASQMKNFEKIAGWLTKEMQDLRSLLESDRSSPGVEIKIQATLKKSKLTEQNADKNLTSLLHDCKRYCKLTARKPAHRRKIVFADEAGKNLCHVRTFHSRSNPRPLWDLL